MLKRQATAAIVIGLAAAAALVHGQVPGATYSGDKICLVCHRTNHKEIVEAFPDTAHAKAMLTAAEATIVADFTDAPFKKEDIAYVLSSGRHQQAYLSADLMVLPGLWSVDEKKWLAHEPVDGGAECVGCHALDFNPQTKKWKQLGVRCEHCHGAGSKHNFAKTEERNATIINPGKLDAVGQMMACGQCHGKGRSTDGTTQYPRGFQPGMNLDEFYTQEVPTGPGRNQQFSDLRQSPKHWDNGVTCEVCHDPHGNTEHDYQLKMPINETCTQCHADHADIVAHAKAVNEPLPEGGTCASCHMPQGRHLFDRAQAHQH